MSRTEEIEQSLKEIKPLLRKEYKISKIGYFGSMAKGSLGPESDIDLLVEFSEPIGWEFLDLKSFLEKRLNRSVDLVTKKALKKQLRESILKQVKYL